jgi:hypothetical protein
VLVRQVVPWVFTCGREPVSPEFMILLVRVSHAAPNEVEATRPLINVAADVAVFASR